MQNSRMSIGVCWRKASTANPVNRGYCASAAAPAKTSDYEREQHAWLIAHLADAATMDIMELDYLLRHDPQKAGPVLARISADDVGGRAPVHRGGWNVLHRGAGGYGYRRGAATGARWGAGPRITGASSGWGSMIARAGVQAARHLDDPQSAIAIAKKARWPRRISPISPT